MRRRPDPHTALLDLHGRLFARYRELIHAVAHEGNHHIPARDRAAGAERIVFLIARSVQRQT